MRVLIVKIAGIGDVIMALPMITALRCRDPEVQISWLCGKAGAPIVRQAGGVEVIPINESKILTGSAREKASEVIKTWAKLIGRRFDLIATGHADSKYRLLSLAASAKVRRSFNRDKGRRSPVPGRYHGHEYVRLITNVDGPEAEQASAFNLKLDPPEELRLMTIDSSRPMVALAPGGVREISDGGSLRRWPLESYRRLASELLGRGLGVAITGAASDAWARTAFEGLPVVDLIGKTPVVDLIAFYGACAAVVSHDSGPLHVAMLAGAPAVALFGPTSPQSFAQASDNVRVIWGGENLPCRPCHDGRTYAPCKSNLCMQGISVAAVLEALDEIADQRVSRGPEASQVAI